MYTRMVAEPRLTAEYPVIADAPQPVLHYLTEILSAHYGRPYARLWMGGRCQKDYHHSVPKQRQSAGARLSLNFSIDVPAA